MSHFAPLVAGAPLNLQGDSVVLLQAGSFELHYSWNGTHTVEKGEKVGILVLHIWPPAYLLTPNSTVSPGKHVLYASPGHIPKAAATSTSEDQATSIILIEGDHFPVHVPIKYLSF